MKHLVMRILVLLELPSLQLDNSELEIQVWDDDYRCWDRHAEGGPPSWLWDLQRAGSGYSIKIWEFEFFWQIFWIFLQQGGFLTILLHIGKIQAYIGFLTILHEIFRKFRKILWKNSAHFVSLGRSLQIPLRLLIFY